MGGELVAGRAWGDEVALAGLSIVFQIRRKVEGSGNSGARRPRRGQRLQKRCTPESRSRRRRRTLPTSATPASSPGRAPRGSPRAGQSERRKSGGTRGLRREEGKRAARTSGDKAGCGRRGRRGRRLAGRATGMAAGERTVPREAEPGSAAPGSPLPGTGSGALPEAPAAPEPRGLRDAPSLPENLPVPGGGAPGLARSPSAGFLVPAVAGLSRPPALRTPTRVVPPPARPSRRWAGG